MEIRIFIMFFGYKKIILILAVFLNIFFFGNQALAAYTFDDTGLMLGKAAEPTGMLDTKVTGSLPVVLGFWATVAFSLVSIVFFILMFYAGFLWMTARGSEEVVTKAKGIITMAIIGLFVLVASYAITTFITSSLVPGVAGNKAAGTGNLEVGPNNPEGCCVDWVATDSQWFGAVGTLKKDNDGGFVGVSACRITTKSDCELQGTTETESDVLAGPEGVGYWVFDEAIKEKEACQSAYCKLAN
ncbi:MAG: hypothetical protein US42_C0008G0065 [Candidatus Magasanikbacteria bacterium GW2011_GWC2_37_14]|uniref:Uncharacterized protein n=1 Tax=Candidatus Magasanikbacteria bacterium GW2011_GWC2_37_14 TaxID=1619046 RepID=A0A0G0ITQ3_9BACT|nr:MAG: hypothetical protein US42_C0008G0065 [Candidatus Magasanikbacteria bacterium GW2011_GWC2_37_14]